MRRYGAAVRITATSTLSHGRNYSAKMIKVSHNSKFNARYFQRTAHQEASSEAPREGSSLKTHPLPRYPPHF